MDNSGRSMDNTWYNQYIPYIYTENISLFPSFFPRAFVRSLSLVFTLFSFPFLFSVLHLALQHVTSAEEYVGVNMKCTSRSFGPLNFCTHVRHVPKPGENTFL